MLRLRRYERILEFGVFEWGGQLRPNFHVEWDAPRTIFARIDRPMNALQLAAANGFHTKKLGGRLSSREEHF